MNNNIYYRVYDAQTKRYFATGYNSTSEQELIECFKSYINCTGWEDDDEEKFESWEQIADYLQEVQIETSQTPFEENDF